MDRPPIPNGFDPMELTSFLEARALVEHFEQILQAEGISIARGSELEQIALFVLELEDMRTGNTHIDTMDDVRQFLSPAIGLVEFMKAICAAHEQNLLRPLVPHFELLNSATVPQNVRRTMQEDATNKVFELHIALTCLRFAHDVALAHPQDDSRRNPDVSFTCPDRRWGLACKVPGGRSPITLYERLEEGIGQIEVSEAETGLVVLSFRNLIDHEAFLPITNMDDWQARRAEPHFGTFLDLAEITGPLDALVDERREALLQANEEENVLRLFHGKKALPGALCFLQTSALRHTERGPMPTSVGRLGLMLFRPISPEDREVIERMNNAFNWRE